MKDTTKKYVEHFAGWERRLDGETRSALHALRKEALNRFVALGFPTTSDEEWRFTNVAPITGIDFRPVISPGDDGGIDGDVARYGFPVEEVVRLVFVDGHFVRRLSSISKIPEGVTVGSMSEVMGKDPSLAHRYLAGASQFGENAFTEFNMAFLRDGAYIRIDDDVEMNTPVHLLFMASGGTDPFVYTARNLFLLGRHTKLSVVESYASRDRNVYWTNVVSDLRVADGAMMEHDRIQAESVHAFHIGSVRILQGRGSSVSANSITMGGELVRNDVTAVFDGVEAECTLNGLSVATGRQLIDNHTTIDHAKPQCASHEMYKAILDGQARGVFNGKIFVRTDAQKTDAKQTNKTLLLSDEATIDTKPQLEIFADDVKCTHGATVGQLDEEQIFYLRSRGIGETDARDLLTFAFATDVINRVHVEPLRNALEAMLRLRLHQGRVAGEG
jgi:Fe-S cluster assembly protein SufD